jgi:hypothetical protein
MGEIMCEKIKIAASKKISLDELEEKLKTKDHMELWEYFSHNINKICKAEARVDENGYVWMRVFADATHVFGDYKDPPKVTHGFGFIIHLSEMWLLAPGMETPYRHCEGRECPGKRERHPGYPFDKDTPA